MNIYQRGKSRYITSVIDGKDYNLSNGQFKRNLDSLNITLADYFEKHAGVARSTCKVCEKPADFHGYNPDNSVKWHSVCGDPKCAKVMYSRAHLSRTPENWSAASEKRRKTFAEKPEVLAERTRIIDEANRRIGDDGLTGYERTAKKRAETLLKKHGRADFANWEKTKKTWQNKNEAELKLHGEKVSLGWHCKQQHEKDEALAKRVETSLKLYGMTPWEKAYNASQGRHSGIADRLGSEIQRFIRDELLFGENELRIGGKYFDISNTKNKTIVEFHGDYWHANPNVYSKCQLVGRKGRTAEQIWEADAKKIKIAEGAGYQVKVVWESEYRKNPKKVIEECIAWLKQ